MHYLYLIKSKTNGKCYIGFTSDLKQRIEHHNNGYSKATKTGIPWELIYYEVYKDEHLARVREKKIKHYGSAYALLKKRLSL